MQIVGCGQGSNGGIAYRCGNLAITFGDGVASGKNTRHIGLHIRIYHHFTPLVQGDLPLQELGIWYVANEDEHPVGSKALYTLVLQMGNVYRFEVLPAIEGADRSFHHDGNLRVLAGLLNGMFKSLKMIKLMYNGYL